METEGKSHCKARTKAGKPCRAAATEGGLCFFHANPDKASELGRMGGRSKRYAAESADPLPTLDGTIAVRDTAARLFEEVYSGKRHHRVAASLAPLLNLLFRATAKTDLLEQRIAELERLSAARPPSSATSPSPTPEEGRKEKADPEPGT